MLALKDGRRGPWHGEQLIKQRVGGERGGTVRKPGGGAWRVGAGPEVGPSKSPPQRGGLYPSFASPSENGYEAHFCSPWTDTTGHRCNRLSGGFDDRMLLSQEWWFRERCSTHTQHPLRAWPKGRNSSQWLEEAVLQDIGTLLTASNTTRVQIRAKRGGRARLEGHTFAKRRIR